MDATTIEQYLEETLPQNDYNQEVQTTLGWRSSSDAQMDADDSWRRFDCNICLDLVQDPVVTLCGHLYCWPCIYKWLHFHSFSSKSTKQQPNQQCPVCKTEISEATLVSLFGRGQTETTMPSQSMSTNLGIVIPQRPRACGFVSPRLPPTADNHQRTQHVYGHNTLQSQLYYSQPATYAASPSIGSGWTTTNTINPVVGMIGELILARVFGKSRSGVINYRNSYHLAGTPSPRVRRHVMQVNKSLSRICFFLYCCAFFCLLMF